MNIPLRRAWTQEEFFAWAGAQEGRFEFDGFQPVAMNGGTVGMPLLSGTFTARWIPGCVGVGADRWVLMRGWRPSGRRFDIRMRW